MVLIIGLHGCLRKTEITGIEIDNVEQQGLLYQITIPTTKTGVSRTFVTSQGVYPLIKKYMDLRPAGMKRLFLQIRDKKCTRQVKKKNFFKIMSRV